MTQDQQSLQWRRVAPVRDKIGESPLWDSRDGAVYWVDSEAPCVRRLHLESGDLKSWPAPSTIGCIALSHAGQVMAGLTDGFYALDLSSGQWSPVALLDPPMPGFRLNDGKTDKKGRLLAGTLCTTEVSDAGFLYRLSSGGAVDKVEKKVAVANATAFSPDGSRLYFGDTMSADIYVYDYDAASGAISNKRLFINTRQAFGALPDGATTDSDGNYWVTLVDAKRIACLNPYAEVMRIIETPMEYPSCLAFGGIKRDILFVTSISAPGMGAPAPQTPDSGYLFGLYGLGAFGWPEPLFGV